MKIVFMGTPEFARRPLEYLHRKTPHNIAAVVTGPDKPSGRGRKLKPTAVNSAATNLGLTVYTPESLKDNVFIEHLRNVGADIFVIVAFRILPEKLFTMPPYGSINLHGSLLPKYRGAAPINWALINGESETGLTTFFLKKKVDTGDIIYQEKIAVGPEETYDELALKMAERAGPVIEKTLDLIETGEVSTIVQDDLRATPAPKIQPFDCLIDWSFPSRNVINLIRGLSSIPGAFTYYRGKKLKIFRITSIDTTRDKKYEPGQIIKDKHRLIVATADGAVEILELLPEGKSRMTGMEFVRGYQPGDGERVGARLEKDKD
jgi:methionyl-tRNA formyltransferase